MDLLGLVKEQLTATVISKVSDFLGESTENTRSALGSAMPSILGGLMQKASTTEGASNLFDVMKSAGKDRSLLNNLSDTLGDVTNATKLTSVGGGLLGSIFGDKIGGLTKIIAGISGIKSGSASSLLSIAAPILMNVIGKQVGSQGMGISGLTSLLMGQKDAVKAALPAGIGSILNVDSLGDFLGSAKTVGASAVENTIEETNGRKPWLPWALLGALLLGALYYWNSCRNTTETVSTVVESTVAVTTEKVDSTLSLMKKTLATGVELNFGEKSIENELISFIEDKSKAVDKTTWFNFRDLKFETGSAVIDSTSLNEIRNIAEILKAYPIDLKIGGYTDNVGNEASNQKLSASRAASVVEALVKMGIDGSRLSPEGYGSQFPMASNDNEEGKAQNRRIAVRVTKK